MNFEYSTCKYNGKNLVLKYCVDVPTDNVYPIAIMCAMIIDIVKSIFVLLFALKCPVMIKISVENYQNFSSILILRMLILKKSFIFMSLNDREQLISSYTLEPEFSQR